MALLIPILTGKFNEIPQAIDKGEKHLQKQDLEGSCGFSSVDKPPFDFLTLLNQVLIS
jgi:hypothetical protein